MPQEIERKFLVDALPPDLAEATPTAIRQAYLASNPLEVRVRESQSADAAAWTLTVKSVGDLERTEVEIAIGHDQFDTLWRLSAARLAKTRTTLTWSSYLVEVDAYHGSLAGLVVAEVEFASVGDAHCFAPPPWFGREITNDARFKNAALAAAPSLTGLLSTV